MIKASELRKGNYSIRVFDSEKNPEDTEIIQVFGVNGNHNTYVCEDDNIGSLEELEPIPLTEGLLLKCGFEYAYNKEWLCLDKNTWIEFNTDDSVNFKKVYLQISGSEIIIEHLHELQNLYFWLKKKELEINL